MRILALAFLALFALTPPAAAQAKKAAPRPAAAKKAPVRPAGPVNWTTMIVKTPQGGYRMGNPNAPLKLVEYGSRSCPHCAHFAETSKPLVTQYVASGRVSWEFRDLPVHPQDIAISMLGRCVPPGRFFPLLDAMFANQPAFNANIDKISDARWAEMQKMPMAQQSRALAQVLGYTAFMQKRGMTPAMISRCLNDPVALKEVSAIAEAAAKLGVQGTPTFFLNGKKLDRVVEWEQLEPSLK